LATGLLTYQTKKIKIILALYYHFSTPELIMKFSLLGEHGLKPLNTQVSGLQRLSFLDKTPYHGEGQAEGLSFSVPKGIAVPPSLRNIYKELDQDNVDFNNPGHGHLENWAKQGVLLLNSVLTVEKNSPASHANQGWEVFTDQVITLLNDNKENLVFLLWGAYANKKSVLIDSNKHLILSAAHPSPFSAYKGFFGCKHFSKTNSYLKASNQELIDWSLPI
jgi:uracil-DNA glycosylase